MNLIFIILLASSWGLFGLRLLQAVHRRRLYAVFSRRVWTETFLCLFVFSLSGKEVEQLIDPVFAGKPVTFYVKSMSLLALCQLHLQTLWDIHPSHLPHLILRRLGAGAMLLLSLVSACYVLVSWMPQDRFRLEWIGFRDGVICCFIVLAFVPSSIFFWRHEEVPAMKIKHAANLVCCLSYLIGSMGNIGAGLLVIVGHTEPLEAFIQAFRPVVYMIAISFLVMLIPEGWFGYLQQRQAYRRIRCVERRLRQILNLPQIQSEKPLVLLLPERLELAIYRSLIFVLDHYPLLPNTCEGQALAKQIHPLTSGAKSYTDLVNEITKLL